MVVDARRLPGPGNDGDNGERAVGLDVQYLPLAGLCATLTRLAPWLPGKGSSQFFERCP